LIETFPFWLMVKRRSGYLVTWVKKTWQDVCILNYGKALKNYKHSEHAYPVYGSGGVVGSTNAPIAPAQRTIVSRKGTLTVYWAKSPSHVIDTAFWLEPKQGLDPKWSYYALKNLDISTLESGSAVPSLSRDDFYRKELKLPTISEQKAIARILGALDDKIEVNQKMNQTLEEIAKAVFKSWFIDFDPVHAKAEGRPTGLSQEISDLFPDELVDSEIGRIPKGWSESSLEDLFSIEYGKTLPTKNLSSDGYHVFGGNGVIGFHSKYLYEDEMTLIACRGAASGKVGRSLPKSFVTNNSLVVNHINSKNKSQRYIEFYIENGHPENYVTGSAQPQLTIENIKHFPFLNPPSAVLEYFENLSDPISKRQLLLKQENKVLADCRDTLLPKLISGELRVPDAEKFLEEAGV
jgi:type I restriction enzyme, S subunit